MKTRPRLLISMCIMLLISACENQEFIHTDLKESDANEIILALKSHGLMAVKKAAKNHRKNASFSVAVKKSKVEEALKILVQYQLPKIKRFGLKEIFSENSQGLIPSKIDERAKLFLAMQGEIESLIKTMPGIIDAKVVFSAMIEPLNSITPPPPPKASAVVILDPTDELIATSDIQKLVASAVVMLEPNDVSVIIKKNVLPTYLKQPQINVKPNISRENSNWIWLIFTLLSLLLAAYGMLRSRWPKKRSAFDGA